MALIVKVFVNDRCIIDTHAVRIAGKPHELCTYLTDDGKEVVHHYDKGAEKLACKLLELYRRRRS